MSYTPTNWENLPSTNTPIKATNLNKIETGISNNDLEIFYKNSDTYSTIAVPLNGYITSSLTQVIFPIVLPKRLDNISNITITNFKAILRGITGYLNNENTNHDFLNDSNYTLGVSIRNKNTIHIVLTKNSAFTNATNNTPVCVVGEVGLTFNA